MEGTVWQGAAVIWVATLWLGPWVFWGNSVRAEILYDQDGIQLQGTARIVTYNAATCHVIEESHTKARYEELKVNDGQPLHVWQLDFTAYNGTGKTLSYLRSDFDIESQYLPCTNWTGKGPGGGASGGPYMGGVQWGNQSRTLSTMAGMGVGEAKQGVLSLAVFHTARPSYRCWSAHFSFGEPDKAGGGRGGTSPSDRAGPDPAPESRKAEPDRTGSWPGAEFRGGDRMEKRTQGRVLLDGAGQSARMPCLESAPSDGRDCDLDGRVCRGGGSGNGHAQMGLGRWQRIWGRYGSP